MDELKHGHYTLRGSAKQSEKPSRLEVWSFSAGKTRTGKKRYGFHLDVYDGDRYIGHLKFIARIP